MAECWSTGEVKCGPPVHGDAPARVTGFPHSSFLRLRVALHLLPKASTTFHHCTIANGDMILTHSFHSSGPVTSGVPCPSPTTLGNHWEVNAGTERLFALAF